MLRFIRTISMVTVLGLSAGLLGCNDPKNVGRDDQMVQNLADQIRQLEDDLARLRAQHDSDQAEIDRLHRELEALRARQTEAVPGGWEGVPGGAMIAIEGTILFDSGKADLKTGAKSLLAQVASSIQQNFPDREIYVFGHTDTDPIRKSRWKDNYELSCQRSLSVVRQLQSGGVSNHMAACGWGEYRPAAENTSRQTKQANRRVEIFAMEPVGR